MFNACTRGPSCLCVWQHITQIEKTLKVFSIFIANPNEAVAEFSVKKIRNLTELQVDGDKHEPWGCLQVSPYLIGMATGGHGGFLNPN